MQKQQDVLQQHSSCNTVATVVGILFSRAVGELALVLMWVTVDDASAGTRSFMAESNLVANGPQGWRRCHTTVSTVCRHYLRPADDVDGGVAAQSRL